MGTVYKETFTKPLPAGAKIIVRKGQRLAEWKDAKGKTPDGTADRRRGPDHRGEPAPTPRNTGMARGSSARRPPAAGMNPPPGRFSASWNAGPNWSKAKCLTAAEDAVIDHQGTPLADHIAAYLLKLEAEGTSPDAP